MDEHLEHVPKINRKGTGQTMTMYLAYMGDILAQIGHEEWKINMVGTCQLNRCGPPIEIALNRYKATVPHGAPLEKGPWRERDNFSRGRL